MILQLQFGDKINNFRKRIVIKIKKIYNDLIEF